MLKNHFTLAIRQLRRSRIYSFINIAGLSTGMAVALLIGLWIHDELTFNTSIPNYKNIAEVMRDVDYNGTRYAFGGGPLEMEAELKNKYPGDFKNVVLGTYPDNHVLILDGKSISVNGQFMSESVTQLLSLNI